jgi:hypothetical protein
MLDVKDTRPVKEIFWSIDDYRKLFNLGEDDAQQRTSSPQAINQTVSVSFNFLVMIMVSQ